MNQQPHHPGSLSVHQLLETFCRLAEERHCFVETLCQVGEFPVIAATRIHSPKAPNIYLSAGIHGDEPAGPLAILELLHRNILSNRFNWFLLPLLNPTGFLAGKRENAQGIDLNRDYDARLADEIRAHCNWLEGSRKHFALSVCLHEDWEASGTYLYEVNHSGRPSGAAQALAAAKPLTGIETAPEMDGHPIEQGIIRPQSDPHEKGIFPEAIHLIKGYTDISITTETPSSQPLEKRVRAQLEMLDTLLQHVPID